MTLPLLSPLLPKFIEHITGSYKHPNGITVKVTGTCQYTAYADGKEIVPSPVQTADAQQFLAKYGS